MKEKLVRNIVCNLVIGLIILGVLFVSLNINAESVSAVKLTPIYKGDSADKVSLMVNVYWGTEYLEPMLEAFEQNDVTTTFFVGGMWVAENNETLKRIYDKGHEIANHGYFHKDHKKLGPQRNREEIEVTHKLVKTVLGIDMDLFAPPSGSYNDLTVKTAEDLGYRTIMWTLDTIDWRDHDSELIYTRATKKIEGGSLVLMHPTEATAKVLDRIIKEIKAKGLTVSKVSEVIGSKGEIQ